MKFKRNNGFTFLENFGYALLVIIMVSCLKAGASTSENLNIILIVADDLGWTDLACYGSDFHESPNLDRFAMQGISFTNAYAASPVCTPTRASIMTGKYPANPSTEW
jgi:hypothetical protein